MTGRAVNGLNREVFIDGGPIVHLRNAGLLVVLCLVLYLPGLSVIPPFDRDEARFAQASKQMVETGDIIDIRFQDTPRYKKPVGAYWLQAASSALFEPDEPTAIWAYRLPSVLAAIFAVLMTHALARLFLAEFSAFIAAGLLAVSFMLTAEAHMAKTDALLLATVLATQLGLARAYTGTRGTGTWLIFWLGIGFGMLIKGPITPLIAVLTIAALAIADRRVQWLLALRPLIGLPLAALLVAPWLIAVQLRSAGAFLESSVGGDLIPKLLGAMESHGSPPGYYLLLLALTFWPGSLLVWPALGNAIRNRTEPAVRFLLAWLISTWILLELVPTKLPHYVLPLYPALAILIGVWIDRFTMATQRNINEPPPLPWGSRIVACLWLVVGLALAVAVAALPVFGTGPAHPLGAVTSSASAAERIAGQVLQALIAAPEAFIAAPLAALVTVLAATALLRRLPGHAALTGIAGAALFLAALAQFTVPALSHVFLSPRIAAAYERSRGDDAPPLIAVGYHEPSLVFLAGTQTRLTSPADAVQALADQPGTVAAVARRHREEVDAGAAARGIEIETRESLAGLNYSNGREVIIDIVTRKSTP